ncbi:ATP-dependent DNA helicase RecG [Allostreptomyces psammosilenae]|uniref:Probable DNA 3'-5' helicase RecG n=1 Tax=Allostreptomyces psammosilenae TaxID=1892865 RepID=A0A852ZWK0_9ACTN|nr:ATP-dependent DNA helicase RecG [Allostreptomyces psammosilenae]NYI06589.1 ATP-dependent DNA helicase RecG [Allostreptomyces psammosilenae]
MPATDAPRLDEPLRALVGDRTAKVLADHLDLRTTGDLLRHYPRRYAERGELTRLDDLQLDEHATVVARIEKVTNRKFRNRRGNLLEVVVTDGYGSLTLTFFNQAWREKELRPGRRGMFAGKVGVFRGVRQLANPDYELLDGDTTAEDGTPGASGAAEAFAGRLIPVYPAAAKMPSWKISQCVDVALDSLAREGWNGVGDPLPESLRAGRGLLTLPEALEKVHRPRTRADVEAARDRLKWDEAFVLQVALARRRAADRAAPAQPRRAVPGGLLDAFDARLPFTLTDGQRAVGEEIAADLAREHPMHRLLQGEVGSGKTLVALRAMLTVVDAGGQAALLAPTEVLAQQHHRSIVEMLGPLAEGGLLGGDERGTKVVLLTGSMGAKARRQALLDLVTGEAGIVVGTHALIEDVVSFHDLGLVVVDEQHRFGVEQRDALRAKAERTPHLLVMTATPIPRTVAMTVFGDLETSVLDQLPAGRAPISSHVVPAAEKPHFLTRAWERLREEVEAGHQAYVVCPRIGDDEDSAGEAPAGGTRRSRTRRPAAGAFALDDGDGSAAPTGPAADEPDGGDEDDGAEGAEGADGERRPPLAVLDVARLLAEGPLAGLRVEVLHGRMAPDAKDEVMRGFASGEVDVLVATTVVEVGVNVPNATVMVIMDADRFGVSQLHQLRGRVGRGSAPGLCLLVTDAPGGGPARARLDAVAATRDGFELSRIDLEQRREGDVLGQAQSGSRSSLRMVTVLEDEELIAQARQEAIAVVAADPELADHPDLRTALDNLVDDERAEYLEKG